MNFRMYKKQDGLWLYFTTKTKREAMIKVQSIADKSGPLVKDILYEFCENVQPWESDGKVLL